MLSGAMRTVRGVVAAALMASAPRRRNPAARASCELPRACPDDLLARSALPAARAAVIASLWAEGRRCVVAAEYPMQAEGGPRAAPTRAAGHWARLGEAGYVFADAAAPGARGALPAPVVRLAAHHAALSGAGRKAA